MDSYTIVLLVIGLGIFGAAWLPRIISHHPITFPIIYVLAGAIIFALPFDFQAPQLDRYSYGMEKLTEITVIISLMGTGLRISRPLTGWQPWVATWRLLAITMPLTIAAITLFAWQVVGLDLASSVLLGAIISPTDPVLASDVQAPPPGTNLGRVNPNEQEVTLALTSEAGLNDGLAFPFTNLALTIAMHHTSSTPWLLHWLAYDVFYKLAAGLLAGYVIGRTIAYFVFRSPTGSPLAEAMEGSLALATTLIAYAATELVHGYGFLAVFIASISIRHYRREHKFHLALFRFSEDIERMFMAILLVLLGGTLSSQLWQGLIWQIVVLSLTVIFVIRPAAGLLGLWRSHLTMHARLVVSFFGIRGIGSLYYLAYAINHGQFQAIEIVWSATILVVLASIFIHGISATYFMGKLTKS